MQQGMYNMVETIEMNIAEGLKWVFARSTENSSISVAVAIVSS
jgi:hypothetical protein